MNKIKEVYSDYSNKSRRNSLLNKILNENIKSEELIIERLYKEAWTRLPLLLINVPHVIKFYVLIFFYARFRHELSIFCCLRFYFNPSLARKVILFGKRKKNNVSNVKFTSRLNSNSQQRKSRDESLDSICLLYTSDAADE